MGTRAVIDIFDEDEDHVVTIYKQFDGYPLGLGSEIKCCLGDPRIINGHHNEKMPEAFNGMRCMAAYLIQCLKDHIGDIYIYPYTDNPRDTCFAEYCYKLYPVNGKLFINVTDLMAEQCGENELVYDGPISEWEIPFDDRNDK